MYTYTILQESCDIDIAKMTAQCAPYMDALKIFWTPDYAHGYFSQNFSWGRRGSVMVPSERALVSSFRPSIHIPLSAVVCPKF